LIYLIPYSEICLGFENRGNLGNARDSLRFQAEKLNDWVLGAMEALKPLKNFGPAWNNGTIRPFYEKARTFSGNELE
jgi:hypothetical protein